MPVSIADLFISVSADVSAAQSGLTQLGNQLDKTSQQFQAAAPAAAVFAGAGAAIGVALGTSVKTAANFEQSMANVNSLLSPADVLKFGDALSGLALKLGRDTVFSSTEAGAAIEELVKAGVPAETILNGAADAAVNLAIATGVKGAGAATVMAQALNTFHLSADQATKVTDHLAGVVNVSAADMSDLRFGLQAVGPVADQMGLSFNDTTNALGLFANNGLRGQDAGTSLKTMLLNLIPQTKQQTAEFRKLGLITADGSNQFFDSAGHIKNLSQIAGVLQGALKGLSDEQKIAALQTIFGTDAIRAAAILYKVGAAGADDFAAQVGQISASEIAATRLNTLFGSLQNLAGSLETVQITIGKFFLPALHAIADAVKVPIDAFTTMSPAAQAAATVLVSVAGASFELIGAVVLLSPIIKSVGPSFAALGGVLAGVTPLMLGVAAVAGILFAAWQANLFGIQGIVQGAFDQIPGVLDQVGNAFGQAGTLWENNILPAIQTIGNVIERTLIPIFNDFNTSVLPVIRSVASAIQERLVGAFNAVTNNPFFRNFALAVQKAFSGNIGGAVDTFIATVGALVPGLGTIVQNVRTTISGFFDQFGPILGNIGLVFQKVFTGDIGGALDTFHAIIVAAIPGSAQFIDLVGKIAEGVGKFAGDIGAGLVTFFTVTLPPVLDRIGQFKNDVGTGLLDFFNNVLSPIADTVGKFAGDVGSGLSTFFTVTLPPILAQIGLFAGGVGDAMLVFFRDTLTPIAEAAGRFAGDIGAGMTTFFTVTLPPILDQIGKFTTDALQPLIGFFRDNLPSVIDTASKFGGDLGAGMVKFFTVDLPPIIASAATVTGDTFASIVDFFQTQGPIIITGAQKFSGDQVKPLADFFAQFDSIKTQIQSLEPLFASISNFGASLNNLQLAIQGLLARTFGSLLQTEFEIFGNTLKNFADTVAPAQPVIDSIGSTVETLGQKLQGATDFINNGATALQNLATSLNNIPADKLPGAGAGGFGINPDLFNGNIKPDTPIFKQSSFNPGGAGNGTGPLIQIGTLNIGSEAEKDQFLEDMAAVLLASSRRVTAPPDNSGVPSLSSGVI